MASTVLALLISAGVPHPGYVAGIITEVALSEQVDAITLTKMIIVESRGREKAINFQTGDYGIAQVNLKAHPEYSITCLLEIRCGLIAGAKILKQSHSLCAYNLGNVGAKHSPIACAQYEAKYAEL